MPLSNPVAITVIFTLLWLPFGKLFHIFQRPAQLGVSFYKDAGERGEQAHCARCGHPYASKMHVDDLIEGIVTLLYSSEHLPVNIGNQHEMTILQFAETINRLVGNPGGITFVKDARSVRDPQQRQPDITRAREILKWEPKISLDEGIHKTIPYFKKKLGLE